MTRRNVGYRRNLTEPSEIGTFCSRQAAASIGGRLVADLTGELRDLLTRNGYDPDDYRYAQRITPDGDVCYVSVSTMPAVDEAAEDTDQL